MTMEEDGLAPIPSPSQVKRLTKMLDFSSKSTQNTMLRLSNEFPPIIEANADTLVYLGVPAQLPHQHDDDYRYMKQHFEKPYLMRSSTLRNLNSKVFDTLLGPKSVRTERRLKKMKVHEMASSTENIKYYIDLTPAIDDDEALILITELTVPKEALGWHVKAKEFGVPATHVCGRDDLNFKSFLEMLWPPSTEEKAEDSKTASKTQPRKQLASGSAQGPIAVTGESWQDFDMSQEEEYSTLRHHSALARLLHAAAGLDPRIDSAAKAWTFCMLAKFFDCAQHHVINHWVVSWLLERGNCHFIQYLPAVSYRIAGATQSQWLMRCSFAILVGQQALIDGITHIDQRRGNPSKQLHVADNLDDDEINRIDHAAAVLTERMRKLFNELTVEPGLWSQMSGEQLYRFHTLTTENEKAQALLSEAKEILKHYVQRMIYMTLSHQYDLDAQRSIPPFRTFRHFEKYPDVPRYLRPVCQQFWHILRLENLPRDYSDTQANYNIWFNTQKELREEGIIEGPEIPYATRKTFFELIAELNVIIADERRSRANDQFLTQVQPSTAAREDVTPPTANRHHLPFRPATLKVPPPSQREATSDHSRDQSLAIRGRELGTQAHWEDEGTSPKHQDDFRAYSEFEKARMRDQEEEAQNADTLNHKRSSINSVDPQFEAGLEQLRLAANTKDSDSDYDFVDVPIPVATDQAANHSDSLSTIQAEDQYDLLLAEADADPLTMQEKEIWRRLNACNSRHSPPIQRPNSPNFTIASNEAVANVNFAAPDLDGWKDPNRSDSTFEETNIPNSRYMTEPARRICDEFISPSTLLSELQTHLYNRLEDVCMAGYVTDRTCDFDIPVGEISSLLCLTDEEWKYLPMWAGGLDDGTGGVFNDGVEPPDAPEVEFGGFRGGAMGIIPGVGSSLGSVGSEFEDIRTEVGISTVGRASRLATDGTATETVISLDD